MPDFPKFEYSNKQVLRAGEALGQTLIWTDETADAIREAFSIANNWRDSHAYPMRRMRYELMAHLRIQGVKGITAARLKRMASIRSKLRRLSVNLNQIQDLFKFQGNAEEEEAYNGRRVELQIRTRLQHSWATAVEAVGLFRKEDMKAGHGNEQWLRLFKLMSIEIGLAEGCAAPADAPKRKDRVSEIIKLNNDLKAANTLENITTAVRYTESYVSDPNWKPDYYLIKYDNINNTVTVEPFSGATSGTRSYDSAEASDNRSGKKTVNTVLVEVDKIEN